MKSKKTDCTCTSGNKMFKEVERGGAVFSKCCFEIENKRRRRGESLEWPGESTESVFVSLLILN